MIGEWLRVSGECATSGRQARIADQGWASPCSGSSNCTRTIRGIPCEVRLRTDDGMPDDLALSLTSRPSSISRCSSTDLTQADIARAMHVSPGTVVSSHAARSEACPPPRRGSTDDRPPDRAARARVGSAAPETTDRSCHDPVVDEAKAAPDFASAGAPLLSSLRRDRRIVVVDWGSATKVSTPPARSHVVRDVSVDMSGSSRRTPGCATANRSGVGPPLPRRARRRGRRRRWDPRRHVSR